MTAARTLITALALALPLSGCSIKKAAVRSLADALSSDGTSSFATDDDLELVGDSIPFALKLMESLHQSAPDHQGLDLALASGFTQYSVVYVEFPAEQLKYDDYGAHRAGLERAARLLLRARDYALEGMDLRHPGFAAGVRDDTEATLATTTTDDVEWLYWLGASWMAAISDSREDPELIGELPIAAAVLQRGLELDESWDQGSLHEVMISVEPALPLPGGAQRAQAHFDRAIELNRGTRASTYVSLATATCIASQDRERWTTLLENALAINPDDTPDARLANAYAQHRARFLLDHTDDLFLDAP